MRATLRLIAVSGACAFAACTHKTEIPALAGPSGLSTTLTVTATPDRLSQDGSAQSSIQVQAIGPDGRPLSGLPVRLDLFVDSDLQDFGSLNAKSIVTGADGVARTVYTAPPPAVGLVNQTINTVTVRAVPVGSDAQATNVFTAMIRLMPTGVILPPASAPTASFTASPTPVLLNVPTTFDASASSPGNGAAAITSYQWNFGDGSSATGKVVTHTYTTTGTFTGSLTVTNDRGLTGSAPLTVTLGGDTSDAFTGDWIISPANPVATQPVLFNADAVRTTPGHQIVQYNWNFGDFDTTQPTTGFLVTHTFARAGTYNVVLSVLDDLGRKKVFNAKPITVGTGNPVPVITFSPAGPHPGTVVAFDASGTNTSGGATITSYLWDFGDVTSGAGNTSTAPNPTHTYAAVGTYQVRLTVTDSAGRAGTTTVSVTVSP